MHFDVEHLSLFDMEGRRYDFPYGPAHTTTREELDGTIGSLAQAAGATIRTSSLFRSMVRDGDYSLVEYADTAGGSARPIRAQRVFLAQGSSARFEAPSKLAYDRWSEGLITCYQYRVYPHTPGEARSLLRPGTALLRQPALGPRDRRLVVSQARPPFDRAGNRQPHTGRRIAGGTGSLPGALLPRGFSRASTTGLKKKATCFTEGCPGRASPTATCLLGGTAAGLVDATTGEGIHEAATSGRFAAEAVLRARRSSTQSGASLRAAHQERFLRRACGGITP